MDGIQLMWPLPAHIDSELAYAAIPAALDVDGANFIGRLESTGGPRPSRPSAGATAPPPFLPVTPDAVLHLLDSHGVDLSTKKVLIVGRSRIVGSPLAYALTQRNATVRSRPVPTQTLTPPNPRPPSQVTLAHTSTSDLAALCLASDLVISCAGVPGLIQPDMISPGAGVVSVGVTFDAATKSLLPDVSADVPAFGHASFLVTTPGGVGPLPLALLLRNVVTAASRRSAPLTATAATPAASVCEVRSFVVTSPAWAVDSDRSVLFREFKMGSHLEASRFLESAARIGDELDHHIERRCAPSLSFLFRHTPPSPQLSLSLRVQLRAPQVRGGRRAEGGAEDDLGGRRDRQRPRPRRSPGRALARRPLPGSGRALLSRLPPAGRDREHAHRPGEHAHLFVPPSFPPLT